jgi:hypothetical protein
MEWLTLNITSGLRPKLSASFNAVISNLSEEADFLFARAPQPLRIHG